MNDLFCANLYTQLQQTWKDQGFKIVMMMDTNKHLKHVLTGPFTSQLKHLRLVELSH